MDSEYETVTIPNLTKFVTACFAALDVSKTNCDIMAASLIEADLMGRNCEGLFKLEDWILDLHAGLVDPKATPKIDKESSATAWVDGKNALGPVVANFCMKLALQKAKQVGAAIVVAKHSNSFGPASSYTKLALDAGCVGFASSNTAPHMVPNRAKYACLGTNPLSAGAPGVFGDYFLLDMSTSVAAPNRIGMKSFKGEYLPVGYAINAASLPETDAFIASKTKYFLPLGSEENHSNYKGSGMSLMIDIMCGILGGAYYGSAVGSGRSDFLKRKSNIGHCFIVIDPKRFAPGFEMRMSELMNHMRNLDPVDRTKPVRVPGDSTKDMSKKVEEWGGLRYPKFVIAILNRVAEMLKVKCVPLIPKPSVVILTPSEDLTHRLMMQENVEESEDTRSEEILVHDIESGNVSLYSVYEVDEDSSDWMIK